MYSRVVHKVLRLDTLRDAREIYTEQSNTDERAKRNKAHTQTRKHPNMYNLVNTKDKLFVLWNLLSQFVF